MCIIIAFVAYLVSGWFVSKEEQSLIAFASGYSNFGFYAIPMGVVLFGVGLEPLIIIGGLGMHFFQDLVGYFILSSSKYSFSVSLKKVLSLPLIYFLFLGLLFNFLNLKEFFNSPFYLNTSTNIRAVFIFLGMFIVGLNIPVSFKKLKFNFKILGLAFFFKFFFWPFLAIIIISMLKIFFPDSSDFLKVLFLLAISPFATIVQIYSQNLEIKPKEASSLVFFGMIFMFVYLPVVIWIATSLNIFN